MTNEEYKSTLEQIYLLRKMISIIPLKEFIKRADIASDIGPFLDPTLYISKHKALEEDKTLAKLLYNVQKLGAK
jgi:hypothetical protein